MFCSVSLKVGALLSGTAMVIARENVARLRLRVRKTAKTASRATSASPRKTKVHHGGSLPPAELALGDKSAPLSVSDGEDNKFDVESVLAGTRVDPGELEDISFAVELVLACVGGPVMDSVVFEIIVVVAAVE